MTKTQQLLEELHVLTEMIGVLTPDLIERIPNIRKIFRILSERKVACEEEIRMLDLGL